MALGSSFLRGVLSRIGAGSESAANTGQSSSVNITATAVAPAGYLGGFGGGNVMVFSTNGTFTVPDGVDTIEVVTVGGGAGGKLLGGGAGGGYARGVFPVGAGSSYAVTVGAGGAPDGNGGASSFGSLISATGGTGTSTPGTGSGGTFRASGGPGGSAGSGAGGGAAGSQLGDGGKGSDNGGGGAVGGIAPLSGQEGGSSPFGIPPTSTAGGPDIAGVSVSTGSGNVNPIGATLAYPFSGFTGGGGGPGGNGGPGAGGGASGSQGGSGGIGGGGGGGIASNPAGKGGIGGGGGSSNSIPNCGAGGRGIVIVRW